MKEITAKDALKLSNEASFMTTIMDNIHKACAEGRTEVRIPDTHCQIKQNDISKLRDLGYEVIEGVTVKFNVVVISWSKAV